ncbi:uncharacterized protein TrAtP1_001961 [Trichoderma atroviride]|uniref:uncharacterized protein n=1 Tax=Hypocrea atroviridis TaxID=63577 RepID=UPI003318EE4C|nr:hypothetical protein TrAtP1_001961 [Trichoderma atroviride]
MSASADVGVGAAKEERERASWIDVNGAFHIRCELDQSLIKAKETIIIRYRWVESANGASSSLSAAICHCH